MDIRKEKLDIVIQAGQSNAEGCGYGDVRAEYVPDSDILYMDVPKAVSLVKAADGDDYYKVAYGDEPFIYSVADNHMCDGLLRGDFSLSFAKKYKEDGRLKDGRRLLIIRAAVGGTGFRQHHWGRYDSVYLKMCEMIKEALALNADNRAVAFLWHQGEHDALLGTDASDYETSLSYIISEVRRLCGAEIPFIAADFVPLWKSENKERCDLIIGAMKKVISNSKNAEFVFSDGLLSNREKNGGEDCIHFCRESLRVLGERYYSAFADMIS